MDIAYKFLVKQEKLSIIIELRAKLTKKNIQF